MVKVRGEREGGRERNGDYGYTVESGQEVLYIHVHVPRVLDVLPILVSGISKCKVSSGKQVLLVLTGVC